MFRTTVVLFIFVAALFLQGCDMPSVRSALPSVQKGSYPPDMVGYTLNGEEVHASDYKGRIVMLVFWKTWCEACKQELQELRSFPDIYENNVVVLAINIGEPADAVKFFRRRFALGFPLLLDPDSRVSSSYGVVVWPTTVLLNQKGQVHWTGVGLETEKAQQEIESLLKTG